jgi:hypothetical protein
MAFSLEDWGVIKATGDQGRVADYIYPLRGYGNYLCLLADKKSC